MKNIALLVLLSFFSLRAAAQVGESAYSFLDLPVSPSVSALGGTNISLVSNENSVALQNPALLTHTSDKLLSLNYMNYVADINAGSVVYSQKASTRATWAVGMVYLDYGSFKETNEVNEVLGEFVAKDMAMHGVYAYKLSDRISGGISAKAIYSAYPGFSSFALGVDLGLNYYNEQQKLSLSMAVKNLGRQLVKYNNEYEDLPWDVQLGISKKFAHAPFRVHATTKYAQKWDMSLRRSTSDSEKAANDKFVKTLFKHLIIGLDFLPSQNFYLAVGYSHKVKDDFKMLEKKGLYGFTFGTGIKVKRFQVGASLFQHHVGGTTLLIGVTTNLNKF